MFPQFSSTTIKMLMDGSVGAVVMVESHIISCYQKNIYIIYISRYQRNIYNFLLPSIMTFIFTRQARMPAKNKIISQINRKYKLKFRHKHVLLTVLSGVLTLQQRCCESFISSTNFLVLSFTLEF